MKSNVPSRERPPRPALPPRSTRRWRVQRISEGDGAGSPWTAIWFDRGLYGAARPDVRVVRVMTDEELDALRHAFDLGERTFSDDRLATLLTDPDLTARRLDYARSVAPGEWRRLVGLDPPLADASDG